MPRGLPNLKNIFNDIRTRFCLYALFKITTHFYLHLPVLSCKYYTLYNLYKYLLIYNVYLCHCLLFFVVCVRACVCVCVCVCVFVRSFVVDEGRFACQLSADENSTVRV